MLLSFLLIALSDLPAEVPFTGSGNWVLAVLPQGPGGRSSNAVVSTGGASTQ